jgi:co-chaperonin GroES (HSP10)
MRVSMYTTHPSIYKHMKIKALVDRVVVLENKSNVTQSGIILNDENDPNKIVIDIVVDSGLKDVKAGDFVIYRKWGKPRYKDEDTGEEYRILKEEDIIALYE